MTANSYKCVVKILLFILMKLMIDDGAEPQPGRGKPGPGHGGRESVEPGRPLPRAQPGMMSWARPRPRAGLSAGAGPPPPLHQLGPGGGDYLLILYFDYLPRCRAAAAVRTELCPTLNYLWSFRLLTRLLPGSNHILSCKQVHSSLTMTVLVSTW